MSRDEFRIVFPGPASLTDSNGVSAMSPSALANQKTDKKKIGNEKTVKLSVSLICEFLHYSKSVVPFLSDETFSSMLNIVV